MGMSSVSTVPLQPDGPLFLGDFFFFFFWADIGTADPDRSNPTRSRFERPLDTIRSFEAAIRGTYGLDPNPSPSSRRGSGDAPPRRRDRGSYFDGTVS